MNGQTHKDITEAVVLAMTKSETLAEAVAHWADYPDRCDCIEVAGIGSHIFGKALCSLTHFCIPTVRGHYRGYSWPMDSSIPVLDLPDREVRCNAGVWSEVVGGFQMTAGHPLRQLLLALDGKASLAADEITWPTAASMAEWLGRADQNEATLGCILHFVQDACVQHHAKGWMLNGHAPHEGLLQEAWHVPEQEPNKKMWLAGVARRRRPLEPRRACEESAHLASIRGVGIALTLGLAVRASGQVVRWWQERVR